MKRLHFKDVTGTNDITKSLIKVGETDILVSADYQNKGRGKRGAVWYGERGKDLFMTSVLPVDGDNLQKYAVISCVGVFRVLKKHGFDVKIKEPNDIYLKGKKLCGILCEAEFFEKRAYMAVGVGINVFSEKFPEEIEATSLSLEKKDFKCSLESLCEEIDTSIKKAYNEKFELSENEYYENLYIKN